MKTWTASFNGCPWKDNLGYELLISNETKVVSQNPYNISAVEEELSLHKNM